MENNLIPLALGRKSTQEPKNYAIIDEENFINFIQFNWSINGQGYASRQLYINGKLIHLRMHREVLPCESHEMIDHINGNKLDNRISNLRVCSKITNGQNSIKHKSKNGRPCTSRFKGVYLHCGKWQCEIIVNKTKIRLGRFQDETDAALVYNDAAKFYFGEFSRLNEIP